MFGDVDYRKPLSDRVLKLKIKDRSIGIIYAKCMRQWLITRKTRNFRDLSLFYNSIIRMCHRKFGTNDDFTTPTCSSSFYYYFNNIMKNDSTLSWKRKNIILHVIYAECKFFRSDARFVLYYTQFSGSHYHLTSRRTLPERRIYTVPYYGVYIILPAAIPTPYHRNNNMIRRITLSRPEWL